MTAILKKTVNEFIDKNNIISNGVNTPLNVSNDEHLNEIYYKSLMKS